MNRTTTALVATAVNNPLQLEEVRLDDLRQDEALVEIHAVGICHLELSMLDGTMPTQFPRVLGHEGAGIIKEMGSEVASTGLSIGDRVLLSYNFCQKCPNCTAGYPMYCHGLYPYNWSGLRQPDGSHQMHLTKSQEPVFANYFGQSSFSHLAIANISTIIPIPSSYDHLSLGLLAPLGCGIQTGAGAVTNTLNLQSSDTIAVFGVGAVGLSAIMAAAFVRRARTIIAIDLHESRLELAKELGATHTLRGDIDGAELLRIVTQEICPPTGVNCAIDTTGSVGIIETMIKCTAQRGRAVSIGAPSPEKTVAISPFEHLSFGRQYIGCVEGDSVAKEMVPFLIEQHVQGKLPLEKIVREYDAKDFATAIEDMKSGKTVKPVLRWK